jgi:hypothetical protein
MKPSLLLGATIRNRRKRLEATINQNEDLIDLTQSFEAWSDILDRERLMRVYFNES